MALDWGKWRRKGMRKDGMNMPEKEFLKAELIELEGAKEKKKEGRWN